MGVGNENTYGSKKNNHSFQHRNLQLLGNISSFAAGLATEATLQQVLAAIQDGQDYESKVVVDDNGNGTTYLEVRIWNSDTQTWELPLYYAAGSNSGVPATSLVAPIIYINPGTILSQIYTELLDQGLTLDAINLNTDNLEGLLTTIDGVLDLSLVELQAINANTDQLEALSTDIKNLLTTIDVDTGNIANSLAALELCCAATNTLLTTIDSVLDQIQTNTLNTVNELTTANVTLAAVQNELIALNNTAGTLATEATLELIRLQLVALNGTDFATENTLASLLAAFNAEDFASETTLGLVLTELQGINLDTNGLNQEATQLLVLAAINSIVTNTNGLATEATLLLVNTALANIYTNLQLNTISTANIDTALTPTVRTHNYIDANGAGSISAGSLCGSVLNNGAGVGTWNGNALPPGVSVTWSPVGNRDTYGAIPFDATGTTFIIEYTT